jgi:hypothetical protein
MTESTIARRALLVLGAAGLLSRAAHAQLSQRPR